MIKYYGTPQNNMCFASYDDIYIRTIKTGYGFKNTTLLPWDTIIN